MSWQRTPDGWRHRPWWKVAINTVLRAVQTRRRSARLRDREPAHELRAWTFDLRHGDLLVMSGRSQLDYQHSVPKTARPVGPRINLTFRYVAP